MGLIQVQHVVRVTFNCSVGLQRVIRKRESRMWMHDTLFPEYPSPLPLSPKRGKERESKVVYLNLCTFSWVCLQAPLPHAVMISVLLSPGVTWSFGFLLCYKHMIPRGLTQRPQGTMWPWGSQNHLFPLNPTELLRVTHSRLDLTLSHIHLSLLRKLMGLPLLPDFPGGRPLTLVSQELLNVSWG